MDPNDLLFLHATLAASIRSQRDEIEQLRMQVHSLQNELATHVCPGPED